MPLLMKLVVLLFGVTAMSIGVQTILRHEARFSWCSSEGEGHIVEGLPAVLVGLGEILTGISVLFYQHLS